MADVTLKYQVQVLAWIRYDQKAVAETETQGYASTPRAQQLFFHRIVFKKMEVDCPNKYKTKINK